MASDVAIQMASDVANDVANEGRRQPWRSIPFPCGGVCSSKGPTYICRSAAGDVCAILLPCTATPECLGKVCERVCEKVWEWSCIGLHCNMGMHGYNIGATCYEELLQSLALVMAHDLLNQLRAWHSMLYQGVT